MSDFYPRKSRPGQYYAWCKVCIGENRKKRPRHLVRQAAKLRNWAKFGLTQERYDELVKKLKGRCEICRRKVYKLHADHDHATNRFRGLLCPRCNVYLGYIHDDPASLERAIDYLNRTRLSDPSLG